MHLRCQGRDWAGTLMFISTGWSLFLSPESTLLYIQNSPHLPTSVSAKKPQHVWQRSWTRPVYLRRESGVNSFSCRLSSRSSRWWPRQTPGTGTAALATTSLKAPMASHGRHALLMWMGAPFIHPGSNMIVLVYKIGMQAYKNTIGWIFWEKKNVQSSFA